MRRMRDIPLGPRDGVREKAFDSGAKRVLAWCQGVVKRVDASELRVRRLMRSAASARVAMGGQERSTSESTHSLGRH